MHQLTDKTTPVARPNRMKRMVAAGEIPLGVILSIPSPRVVEMCAIAGADFVLADLEHHPFDWETLENIVRACEATGITPTVRTMDSHAGTICRLLDIGFQGINVPHVDSAEEARAIVRAALYPPQGERGVDLTRWSGFGLGMSARDYLPLANAEVMIGVAIETLAGLQDAEAIAAVAGIDSLGVGETDLSTSMGFAGDHHHPEVQAAARRVRDLAVGHGKHYGGTPFSAEDVPALVAGGARTISMSMSRVIAVQIRALAAAVRKSR